MGPSRRDPTWVIIGVAQPILYLVLFGPLLKPLASQLGTGNAYWLFVPGILVQLGDFGALFVGFGVDSRIPARRHRDPAGHAGAADGAAWLSGTSLCWGCRRSC